MPPGNSPPPNPEMAPLRVPIAAPDLTDFRIASGCLNTSISHLTRLYEGICLVFLRYGSILRLDVFLIWALRMLLVLHLRVGGVVAAAGRGGATPGALPFDGAGWASGAVVRAFAGLLSVAVEVGGSFRVVGDHGVKIEGLRVGEIGVRHRNGDGGPVGTEPAAKAAGIVAGTEVVVAGFRVSFLAFEFVVLRAGVGVGMLAAVRIEVSVVANRAIRLSDEARSAEQVFHIILGVAACGKHRDTPAAKEDVFVESVSVLVSLCQDFAARAVPVELAAGFGNAAAAAVVSIGDTGGGFDLAFRVVRFFIFKAGVHQIAAPQVCISRYTASEAL